MKHLAWSVAFTLVLVGLIACVAYLVVLLAAPACR